MKRQEDEETRMRIALDRFALGRGERAMSHWELFVKNFTTSSNLNLDQLRLFGLRWREFLNSYCKNSILTDRRYLLRIRILWQYKLPHELTDPSLHPHILYSFLFFLFVFPFPLSTYHQHVIVLHLDFDIAGFQTRHVHDEDVGVEILLHISRSCSHCPCIPDVSASRTGGAWLVAVAVIGGFKDVMEVAEERSVESHQTDIHFELLIFLRISSELKVKKEAFQWWIYRGEEAGEEVGSGKRNEDVLLLQPLHILALISAVSLPLNTNNTDTAYVFVPLSPVLSSLSSVVPALSSALPASSSSFITQQVNHRRLLSHGLMLCKNYGGFGYSKRLLFVKFLTTSSNLNLDQLRLFGLRWRKFLNSYCKNSILTDRRYLLRVRILWQYKLPHDLTDPSLHPHILYSFLLFLFVFPFPLSTYHQHVIVLHLDFDIAGFQTRHVHDEDVRVEILFHISRSCSHCSCIPDVSASRTGGA
ncbi:hypothetical protein Ccrd_020225 [Cynara cardunculus var. scolymus]|uniref:Uncharacterized protein n=1 Tax=Cynara cardunculus var. scolymus TaxID=59895 RepID=A0A118K0V7_CYNCS|nr:hypothetical protein Ccrd_020225 [Cynara cardunculus var. scolymus]